VSGFYASQDVKSAHRRLTIYLVGNFDSHTPCALFLSWKIRRSVTNGPSIPAGNGQTRDSTRRL